MENKVNTIKLLYEQSCAGIAREVSDWLQAEGIAVQNREPLLLSSGFCRESFQAVREIAGDCAVIFISDTATGNQDWQHQVRDLPSGMRLIPVGRLKDVDYNDPEILPPSIGEINFIVWNEHSFSNILDSLITSPEFYHLKNHLMIRYNSWIIAHYEGNLLTDRKQIAEYHKQIEKKLASEKDPEMRRQLEGLLEYLKASDIYTRKIKRRQIWRWTGRGILAAAVIALLLGIRFLSKYYHRATYTNLVVSINASDGEPSVNAIKMVESITNPFSADSAKQIAYARLVDLLDRVWEQNPIGINYNYLLNDYAIPEGDRYLWTADNNGNAILWDTWDGTVKEREQLSIDPLMLIIVQTEEETEGEDLFVRVQNENAAAVDANGEVFLRRNGSWSRTGTFCRLDPQNARGELLNDRLLVWSRDGAELYEVQENSLVPAGSLQADQIPDEGSGKTVERLLQAVMQEDDTVLLAASVEGQLHLLRWDGTGCYGDFPTGIEVSELSQADLKGSLLVVSDTEGQVYRVQDQDVRKIPLVLRKPLALRIVNDETIVYHERNMGTGLYDMQYRFDYGDVLGMLTTVSEMKAGKEMLTALISYDCHSVSLKELLPVPAEEVAETVVQERFDSAAAEAAEKEAVIRSIRVTQNGLLHLVVSLKGEETDVVLDPAGILENESGYQYNTAQEDLPDSWSEYDQEPYRRKAVPQVVGLLYVPPGENNDTAYSYALAGMDDGTFAEIGIQKDTGVSVCTCLHQIPSRSPIVSIEKTENGYLLTDKLGLVWRCRSGISTETEKGICEAVKEKLHTGVTANLLELVSPEIQQKLGLRVYPGGDGKEWE